MNGVYFYIRDEVLGPMVMRVASFFPFRTTYYLNGHSFIEQELNRAQIKKSERNRGDHEKVHRGTVPAAIETATAIDPMARSSSDVFVPWASAIAPHPRGRLGKTALRSG